MYLASSQQKPGWNLWCIEPPSHVQFLSTSLKVCVPTLDMWQLLRQESKGLSKGKLKDLENFLKIGIVTQHAVNEEIIYLK